MLEWQWHRDCSLFLAVRDIAEGQIALADILQSGHIGILKMG